MSFVPYPKIYSIGHRGFDKITELCVLITEKLDGSNVSIRRTKEGLLLASRTKLLNEQSPGDAGLFKPFLAWVEENRKDLMLLPEGITLWGEMVTNHNVLKYTETCPFVLFDVSWLDSLGVRNFLAPLEYKDFLSPETWRFVTSKIKWAPLLHSGILPNLSLPEFLTKLLQTESILGGKIEGVVIKNYDWTSLYDTPLFVKYVAPEFKEVAKMSTEQGKTIEVSLAESVFTVPRIEKCIQKMKENGTCTDSVKDIGPLIGVVCKDVHNECLEEIKELLFDTYWKRISRVGTNRVVKIYKELLLARLKGKENESISRQEDGDEVSKETAIMVREPRT